MTLRRSPESAILGESFSRVKAAKNSADHAAAMAQLEVAYPGYSAEEIRALYLRAADLRDACFDPADQCREGKMTEPEALALLQARHPGFPSATYGEALGWGYFLSR